MVPREHRAEGLLALAVLKVGRVAMVDGEHGQLAVRVDVPGIESEPVVLARVVVDLLQEVEVLERSAAVAFYGVVLVDDVHLLIVDVLLLVVVSILVVVGRGGVDHTRRGLPVVIAIGQAQELVEGLERPDALYILQADHTGLLYGPHDTYPELHEYWHFPL